jgi:hypothetical protein
LVIVPTNHFIDLVKRGAIIRKIRKKHGNVNYHKEANLKADHFMDVMSRKIVSIDKQIDKVHHQQALENQEKLKPIIKTIILCGRRCLPLRAYRDYGIFNLEQELESNKGNFRALLRARIHSGGTHLKQHLMTCGKNSMNIQNQIIDACDEINLNKFNNAKCFTVLIDETSNILCVRYIESILINNFKRVEQFLKFVPVESTRFLKHKNLLTSFKCLLPPGKIQQMNKFQVLKIFSNFMKKTCNKIVFL